MGFATAEEISQVQAWAHAYPEVADELSAIEKSMEKYAFANSVEPARDLKSKILDKVSTNNSATKRNMVVEATPKKVYSMSPIWQRAAAAAILLLIASIVINIIYYNKYKDADLAYQKKNEELIAQTDKLKSLDQDMSIVQNKYSRPVSLEGLPAAPEATAKIFWMKNTGEVYIDPSNLPEAPEGKEYQLWGIVDGKPVDGGMILTSKKGNRYHIQKMKNFGKAEAFAVTLETKGGNPTPKGSMFVMGKL